MTTPLRLPCRFCGHVRLGLEFESDSIALLCFGCAERLFAFIESKDETALGWIWCAGMPFMAAAPGVRPSTSGGDSAKVIPFPARLEARDTASELADELRQSGDEATEDSSPAVDEVFRAFKEGLEKVVGPDDAQTHVDLGIAYREMGRLKDALLEWMLVVRSKTSMKAKRAALEAMFDRSYLREDAMERLKGLLFPG